MNRDWDLYFVCVCIEGLSRKLKLSKSGVIRYIGKDGLEWMLSSASVNHSEPLPLHLNDLIERFKLPKGSYELDLKGYYEYPSEVAMGTQFFYIIEKLYKDRVKSILEVFSDEWFCVNMDNYDLPFFWQSPAYLWEAFTTKNFPNVMG